MPVTSHASSMKLLLLPVIVLVSLPLTTSYERIIASINWVSVRFLAHIQQQIVP